MILTDLNVKTMSKVVPSSIISLGLNRVMGCKLEALTA